jgi:hypothetical protein
MLNNQDFINLERRLWREGNPLCDELVSTRDELSLLIHECRLVLAKYSPMLNKVAGLDLDYMREWDNLGDYLDNVQYALEGKVSS